MPNRIAPDFAKLRKAIAEALSFGPARKKIEMEREGRKIAAEALSEELRKVVKPYKESQGVNQEIDVQLAEKGLLPKASNTTVKSKYQAKKLPTPEEEKKWWDFLLRK